MKLREESDRRKDERGAKERAAKPEPERVPLKARAPPERLAKPWDANPPWPPADAWPPPPRCAKVGTADTKSTNAVMRSGRCIRSLYAGPGPGDSEIRTLVIGNVDRAED